MSERSANSETAIETTCPYCGVGCGLFVDPSEAPLKLYGDPAHPANLGRLCSKGSALGETMGLDGRLLFPEIDGQRVDWDTALDAVADGFRRIIDEHGPDAVAFYVSGQILTEDYYVANKLMKGFIGSGNIDTNSRLCMSSAVAGHKRAFGSDTVPGCYEDLELADLLVLVGSNTAWAHPVVYQRIVAAKKQRPEMKIVVIDPRRTATCDIADVHLGLRPGSDAYLFNGLLNYLRREDHLDWEFLEGCTEGFAAAMQAVKEAGGSIPEVAAACELPEASVAEFFRLFARTDKAVTVFSQGINQSSSGVDKVNSIINVHLATGRIGKPGMGPFSITGQPNAMGGREVGGLANQLAAHMDFASPDDVARVSRFWRATNMAKKPGLKAVDLFQAVEEGRIKAIWIMATNPVVSLPDADRARAALERCELVVVSDCVRQTDTTACANILLPATTWGEKDGTVTNSERRISRQRGFLTPPGESRHDWWVMTQVARRLGYADAFPYESAAAIFREHARLSGFENEGRRDFDISALAELDDDAYEALQPVQWPVTADAPKGTARLFGDGEFFTPSGKAQFVAVKPRMPAHAPDDKFPLVLNTGRIRDQWHTMTRTGKTARLMSHINEPFVQVHPVDAANWNLTDGALAQLTSACGRMLARVAITEDQRPGSVFVPMHWNEQFANWGRVDALVNPVTDPISGQPESKHTPVRVEAYQPRWYGFLLTRDQMAFRNSDYWVAARGGDFWRYELAGEDGVENWTAWAHEVFGAEGDWLEFADSGTGRFRLAKIVEGRLQCVLFIAPTFELPPRTWLAQLFTQDTLDDAARMSLLAGRPGAGQKDAGRTVCSCFGVGMNTIIEAIQSQRLTSPEAIGEALKAGTNCGSCVPELKAIIAEVHDSQATA